MWGGGSPPGPGAVGAPVGQPDPQGDGAQQTRDSGTRGWFPHTVDSHAALKLSNQRLCDKEKRSRSTPALQSCDDTCDHEHTCMHTCAHACTHMSMPPGLALDRPQCPRLPATPGAGGHTQGRRSRPGQGGPDPRARGAARPFGLEAAQGPWGRSSPGGGPPPGSGVGGRGPGVRGRGAGGRASPAPSPAAGCARAAAGRAGAR